MASSSSSNGPRATGSVQRQLQLCRTLLEFQLDGIFKTVIKSLHVCVCGSVSACAKRKCKERMQIDLGPLTSTCINFAAIVIWPRNANAAKSFSAFSQFNPNYAQAKGNWNRKRLFKPSLLNVFKERAYNVFLFLSISLQ